MEYLSTSISAILAARRSTLAPKGGRDYRTKWLPGLGIEFEYPMQWKYESETANMDTRKNSLHRQTSYFLAASF